MKVFTAIVALVVVFQTTQFSAKTVNNEKRTITVIVPNVTSNSGTMNYALYNKEGFMVTPLQATNSTIENKKSKVVFEGVTPGEYAIICFHDANSNKKMDFKANGMPLEDYGISNNPVTYGPPEYDSAKFVVSDKDVTLEIRL